jgi:hypothetical protein
MEELRKITDRYDAAFIKEGRAEELAERRTLMVLGSCDAPGFVSCVKAETENIGRARAEA